MNGDQKALKLQGLNIQNVQMIKFEPCYQVAKWNPKSLATKSKQCCYKLKQRFRVTCLDHN